MAGELQPLVLLGASSPAAPIEPDLALCSPPPAGWRGGASVQSLFAKVL